MGMKRALTVSRGLSFAREVMVTARILEGVDAFFFLPASPASVPNRRARGRTKLRINAAVRMAEVDPSMHVLHSCWINTSVRGDAVDSSAVLLENEEVTFPRRVDPMAATPSAPRSVPACRTRLDILSA